MINNLALLGIGILSFFNTRKLIETKAKIETIDSTTEKIHTLSNSNMAAQLKINVQLALAAAVVSHRLAAITKEPSDFAAAVASDVIVKEHEALYQTHLIQQAKVDSIDKDKKGSG